MSRNPKLQEFEMDRRPRKGKTGVQKFIDHIFDSETGTMMGRSPESWGRILIFYAIFYGALVALFSICMVTFLQQFINPRVPRLQQEQSLIGTSPGLGFRPLPVDVRSTLIWYKGTGYESYKYWEDQLIDFLSDMHIVSTSLFQSSLKRLVDTTGDHRAGSFLAQHIAIAIQRGNAASIYGTMPRGFFFIIMYKKKGQTAGAGQNIHNCDFRNPPPPGKVCDVDIRGWEPCIEENHFSFHKSSPCIFLKLNKIFGWRPEYYNDTQHLPSEMPVDLQMHIRNITAYNRDYANMVWVSCQGETPADKENIGSINYYPYPGFPGYFYPYNNAEGYLSPLVAIHLIRPRTGILINIECRAWAQNIKYDRRERLGVVHFELMIE